MSAWSEGYVSDINYTYGYYQELNPQRVIIPFLMAGLTPPNIQNACELGFGQGVSLNIHAMAGNAKWYGTDFNPSHAFFAQNMANQSDADKVYISDQGFKEFCAREDLPEFDFIGLHGIWSWISDENRDIIVDFLRRKLKVGGVLYISYNTLPGWAAASPIRHLLVEHERIMSSSAHHRAQNAKSALEASKQILELSQRLCNTTPTLIPKINELVGMDPHYLAHEYLNKDWQPMYFSQVEALLESAKLNYACSVRYLEDFPECLFDSEQQEYFKTIENPSFAQTIKDYMLNKQFRCDYWVKGQHKLNLAETAEIWKKLNVLMIMKRSEVSMTVSAYRITNLMPEIFDPILDILADNKIHSVADILTEVDGKVSDSAVFNALALLYGKNDILLAQPKEYIEQARPRCDALNRYLLEKAKISTEIYALASPVTGEGMLLGLLDQLFSLAHQDDIPHSEWEDFIWNILLNKGQRIVKDNQTLEDEAENREEIKRLQELFLVQKLPILQELGILK